MYTNHLLLTAGAAGVSQPGDEASWHESLHIGDPFVLRFNGKYYLYPSSGGCPGVRCWESDDLVRWTYRGLAARDDRLTNCYAPEVAWYNGTFYLVGSPRGEGHYLFAADSPLGPFRPVRENFGRVIDGSLFADNDGQLYFTHAEFPCIYGSKIETDGTLGEDRPLIGTSMGHWTEGPGIFFRGGRHYITMTGNHLLSRGYRIDWAVSENGPLGPYRVPKRKTILVNTEPEHGSLGHSSNTIGPDLDSWWIIYHNFPIHSDGRRDAVRSRSANLDRMLFNGERLSVSGPTTYPAEEPRRPLFGAYADDDAYSAGTGSSAGSDASCSSDAFFEKAPGFVRVKKALPEGDFTAEYYLVPGEAAAISFAGGYALRFGADALLWEKDGEVLASSPYIRDFRRDVLWCVRLEKSEDTAGVLLGGMYRMAVPAEGLGGKAVITGSPRVSYVAFSPYVGQSSDAEHYHAITQPFDAAMFADDGEHTLVPDDDGGYNLCLKAGENVRYRVNNDMAGAKRVLINYRSADGAELILNGPGGQASAVLPPSENFTLIDAGTLSVSAGCTSFGLSAASGAAELASICLIPAIPAEKQQYEGLALCKAVRQTQALLQHDKGFIDRFEGLQMDRPVQSTGILSERAHMKQTVETRVIFRDDNAGFAGTVNFAEQVKAPAYAGIMLRLSEDSFFEDQVVYGMRGYFLGIDRFHAKIVRMDFGGVTLAETDIPGQPLEQEITLRAEADGSRLKLWLNGSLILTADDPDALPFGRLAVGSFGARVTFPAVSYEAD